MKFNKMYIYILVVVFAVAGVVIYSSLSGKKAKEAPPLSEGSQVPGDETHQGMGGAGGTNPGPGNVKDEIKQKMAELEKAANDNPNDTTKLLEYAEFMGMAHKPDKAIDGYNRYLKINPNNVEVLFALSSLYFQKKDFDNSIATINRALKINPKNTEAIFYLGFVENGMGNKAKAKATWEKLIKDFPGSTGANLATEELKK
ncbi:hypothetical protein MASR1M107_28240 [Ignavibacteriales bacterium]